MSSFFRKSKAEIPEVRETTDAEVAERAARLRALDEEIERRNGRLRQPREELTTELEPVSSVESEQAPPVAAPENGARSGVDEQLAAIEQIWRETVSPLALRVEAVEMSLRESQRERAEAPVAAHPVDESLERRLVELEGAATAGATDIDRLSALSARVETLETSLQETQRRGIEELRTEQELIKELLEQRLAELEAAAAETQRRSVEELRVEQELIKEFLEQRLSELEAAAAGAARGDDRVYALAARIDALETSLQETQRKSVEQEPLEHRLAALDAATSEASRSNQAVETRVGEIIAGLSKRVDSVDTRLAAAEETASVSNERLRTMAESILDRLSDQPSEHTHD